jgi:hypothetical protein
MGELLQVGTIAGLSGAAMFALRGITQLVVVVWSLRADDAGRKHAIALLRILGGGRIANRFRGG